VSIRKKGGGVFVSSSAAAQEEQSNKKAAVRNRMFLVLSWSSEKEQRDEQTKEIDRQTTL
jgi:hypothetical protein